MTQVAETKQQTLAVQESFVQMYEGVAIVSSLDVASAFDKRHDHVLRDIRQILADMSDSSEAPMSETGETAIINDLAYFIPAKAERKSPLNGAAIVSDAFLITEEGFALLAMGFTGVKALRTKLTFLEQFSSLKVNYKKLAGYAEELEYLNKRLNILNKNLFGQAAFLRSAAIATNEKCQEALQHAKVAIAPAKLDYEYIRNNLGVPLVLFSDYPEVYAGVKAFYAVCGKQETRPDLKSVRRYLHGEMLVPLVYLFPKRQIVEQIRVYSFLRAAWTEYTEEDYVKELEAESDTDNASGCVLEGQKV